MDRNTTRISTTEHSLTIATTPHGIVVRDEVTGNAQHITATVLETIANQVEDSTLVYNSTDSTFPDRPHRGELPISYSGYDRTYAYKAIEECAATFGDPVRV